MGRDISARPIAPHLLLSAGSVACLCRAALLQPREIGIDQFQIGRDARPGRPCD